MSSLPDRFWSKVDKSGECWEWTGSLSPEGYGRISVGGRPMYAHRLSCEDAHGPIPDGYTVDHLCRVRKCVRPDHLEPVTQRENCLRGESPAAKHARKTHCVHGHEFTRENTYVRPDSPPGRPYRECRTCIRARTARKKS